MMKREHELRTDVFELLHPHQLDMLEDASVENKRIANGDVAKVVSHIIRARNVYPQVRVELLSALLDGGMSVDDRFGGPMVNGCKVVADGKGRSSVLMLCIREGFVEGSRLLLERGANARKSKEDYGYNILEQAIGRRDKESVRVILQYATLEEIYGLDQFPNDGRQAPVGLFGLQTTRPAGVVGDEAEIVEMVLGAGLPRGGLLAKACAAGGDTPGIIDVLVKYGADVNDPANPPLVVAASNGKPATVQRLLELGADPAVKTSKGGTLMQCAGKYPEVKQVLRSWKIGRSIEGVLDEQIVAPSSKRTMGVLAL